MKLSRRALMKGVLAAPLLTSFPAILKGADGARPTDILVEDVTFAFEDFKYRTPYMFGGRTVDRVTMLNVQCTVRTAAGKTAKGFGAMSMGNMWAFPSKTMDYATTLGAMKALAGKICKITKDYPGAGHPIDINWELEPEYLKAAAAVSKELKLKEPIPKLAMLVVASPFDAALHDAYGKVHGRSVYQAYGKEFMAWDLSKYLGPEFKGEYLDRYVMAKPLPRIAMYHSIGAADPIVEADIKKKIGDGMPETLPEWIRHDGLTHLKIKLNGSDLKNDVERVLKIDRATAETQQARGVKDWFYCCDFNENCPNVEFLLEFLKQIKEKSPAGFEKIQYIEQPTKRDLKADRKNTMHEAAKLRPVVIDESLTDMETMLLAREMGYTGVALKACKGQSQAMLMAAAAQKYKMFLCVQDLTCPGAALVHSAGIAAHVPGTAAIEANAREYVPVANKGWEERFPGLFHTKDGMMDTSTLDKPGLSAVEG